MRRFLGKKGFSLLELIIVIAIIAVLLAMIVPSLSSSDAHKKAAVSGAKDFYSAAQYLVTKYSRFEGYISNEMKNQQLGNDENNLKDDSILMYDKRRCGNYPPHDYVMLAMAVRKSQIVYVNAVSADTPGECEAKIFKQEGLTVEGGKYVLSPFERVFAQDIDPLFEQQDGIYYATFKVEGTTSNPLETVTNPIMKVVLAGYCFDELPIASGDFDDYKQSILLFSEDYRLANGSFMGVCSSLQNSGEYVGNPKSYFSAVTTVTPEETE